MRLILRARWALAAALIVVVAGCSGNKGKIEGTNWVSQEATVKGQELPAGARQLQFHKDGHLLFVANAKPYKGSYALGMGPAVTFTFEEDWEGRKIHPEKVVIDGDHLVLTGADGSEIPFQKVN
jgi:hypothetical protein